MGKRGRNIEIAEKAIDPNSKFYQDFLIFQEQLQKLKNIYNVSTTDILNLAQEEIQIPVTIFTKDLSPLETIVKYLKENLNYDYSKIGDLLGRDRKTVWQAQKNASKKHSDIIQPTDTPYNIPISKLRTKLSILEAIVVYLKDHFELSYHKIGELLQRNERTIWTVYSRAQKK